MTPCLYLVVTLWGSHFNVRCELLASLWPGIAQVPQHCSVLLADILQCDPLPLRSGSTVSRSSLLKKGMDYHLLQALLSLPDARCGHAEQRKKRRAGLLTAWCTVPCRALSAGSG